MVVNKYLIKVAEMATPFMAQAQKNMGVGTKVDSIHPEKPRVVQNRTGMDKNIQVNRPM